TVLDEVPPDIHDCDQREADEGYQPEVENTACCFLDAGLEPRCRQGDLDREQDEPEPRQSRYAAVDAFSNSIRLNPVELADQPVRRRVDEEGERDGQSEDEENGQLRPVRRGEKPVDVKVN